MATTKQIFTGDPSQLNAAYKDIAQHVTRLEDTVHRLAASNQRYHEASIRGGQSLEGVIKKQIIGVVSLAGAWNAVEQSLGAANRQMEHHQRINDKAKETQLQIAESQAGVVTAFSSRSSAERAALLKQSAQIQSDTRFPDINALNQALAAAGSAGATPQEATAAVAAAALLTRHKTADVKEFTGSAFDVGKASGVKDPRRNLGFLLNVGEAARVEGLENTFRNVSPAIISGVNTVPGQDRVQASKEIGAFFAAASQMTGDRRGDRTETFTTQFAVQLRDFFAEGREIAGPGGQKLRIKPASDPGTFSGRQAALQADPVMARQFLEKANFLQAYKISAEQALQSGSQFTGFQRDAAGKIDFSAGTFNAVVRDLESLTPELQLNNLKTAAKGISQQFEQGQGRKGRESTVRELVKDAIEKTGGTTKFPFFFPGGQAPITSGLPGERFLTDLVPGLNSPEVRALRSSQPATGLAAALANRFHNFIADSAFDQPATDWSLFTGEMSGMSPEGAGISVLRARQQQILSKRRNLFGGRRRPDDLTADERGQFDLLAQLIEELIVGQQEQTRLMKERQPAAGPAANADRGGNRER